MPIAYQDEQTVLHHGDALDILPSIDSASAAAVVTDPPYMINSITRGTGARSTSWADLMNAAHWYTAWIAESGRILTADGSLWIMCSWRTLPVLVRAALNAQLPPTSAVVWDKDAITVGGPKSLRSTYEMCVVLAKPEFRIRNRSVPDVWRIRSGNRHPHGHPAEKPEALIRRVLATLDLPAGSVILDPFTGSGTTLAVCRSLGLYGIGIEAEQRWCRVAEHRIRDHSARPSALQPTPP